MQTLAELQASVWDWLDSASDDPFFPEARVTAALNTALRGAADRLGSTNARRRYMKRVADLSADATFDPATSVWALPADFRRPFRLVRSGTPITEVQSEDAFGTFGTDGYMVVGRELWLTTNTDASGLEVYYVYAPAALATSDDTPDWIEGYEEYLAVRAAGMLIGKGDTGNPQALLQQAQLMWPDIVMAARQSSLPGTITSKRGAYLENWL